ncbi:MAG: sulfurtransferase [Desulfobulbus sp.]|uniref:rhodanese-like domain-containing protein n=1 Tax=Desulfobulbus sp. TaxID=895 RepID=UPI0028474433|nr:rhodanese-like domain-containing protein [Desulfobulbus sp.]MDR2550292.1 sulfurtransferase [Desulfobulbus sp.]
MTTAFQDVSAQQVREYMSRHEENEYLLIDVRQPGEYARGHIPGAILIPLGELPGRLRELPVDRDIFVYCHSGKRSKGAAIFIGSRPYVAGTIFNIQGGIHAWEGQLLPFFPPVTVFDSDGSDGEILHKAMELERGAERFYAALGQRYGSVPWSGTLTVLAESEVAHARIVYGFWTEMQTDPPEFTELYGNLAGTLVEGGLSVEALLTTLEEGQPHPCRSVLEMALTIEYAAYDLYRSMAHRFLGTAMEAAFNAIAEAEKVHMLLAARALGQCSDA